MSTHNRTRQSQLDTIAQIFKISKQTMIAADQFFHVTYRAGRFE